MIVTVDREPRYVALVRSFPVLERFAPGVGPAGVNLGLMDAWAAHDREEETLALIVEAGRNPFPGEGAQDAARFVLNLWSTRFAWRSGRFDLFRALTTWDHEQIAAFQRWAANPFRP